MTAPGHTAPPVPLDLAKAEPAPTLWRDVVTLTKPEISLLVMLSALAGFLLGTQGAPAWDVLAWTLVGTVLAAAGGGTLNHVLEVGLDRQMRRTASRPLPGGRIPVRTATWLGVLMVGAGLGILCPLVNPLTGVLAAITVALYLFVYTPLKRITTLNTFVGTIPGALPALGGFTAATGVLGPAGWAWFAVLLCWQIPHFYALAWMYRADYARARYAMLPVVRPDGRSTVVQVVVFTALMIGASLIPGVLGAAGTVYMAGAAVAGALFVRPVVRFARDRSNANARLLLKATIYYIPVLVALVAVDHIAGL